MKFEPTKKQYSIVLLGDFNPSMFQPEWFSKNNIISTEEAEFAKGDSQKSPLIVTPQVTIFSTSQFSVRVETNRFTVICEKEPVVVIEDFVCKTFEKLGGIVIKAYGLNYNAHYPCDSLNEFQRIGDNLAPKSFWEAFLEDEVTGDDRKSGLVRIQMVKNKKDDKAQTTMTLEPSNRCVPGVYIASNYHVVVPSDEAFAESVMEDIQKTFDSANDYMKTMQKELLERAVKEND